jgi:hypothetical protein
MPLILCRSDYAYNLEDSNGATGDAYQASWEPATAHVPLMGWVVTPHDSWVTVLPQKRDGSRPAYDVSARAGRFFFFISFQHARAAALL